MSHPCTRQEMVTGKVPRELEPPAALPVWAPNPQRDREEDLDGSSPRGSMEANGILSGKA